MAETLWRVVLSETSWDGYDIEACTVGKSLKEAQEKRQRLINNTVLWETPAGEVVSIYEGSFVSGLKELDREKFQWNKESEFEGSPIRSITLNEIYRQAKLMGVKERLITVFYTSAMDGVIYLCGNYAEGDWEAIGKTKGYA